MSSGFCMVLQRHEDVMTSVRPKNIMEFKIHLYWTVGVCPFLLEDSSAYVTLEILLYLF